MAGKFMNLKKLIIPTMTLILMTSQLAGCALVTSREMVDMINQSETIEIELAKPDYGDIAIDMVDKEEEKTIGWTQLDQLKTYNNGFRQAFDEVFNINIVTESGVNGKSGSLYVDEAGDRNGNTSLEDAFRNKVFVEKYWNNADIKSELAKIATQAYSDVKETDSKSLLAAINAYYNLTTENESKEFKGTTSLTREQFYSMVYKSNSGVSDIKTDENYVKAVGGETIYTRFAQEVDEYGFLSVENGSLNRSNVNGAISRAEAIHLIVQSEFKDIYSDVSGKEKAFSDTKNGGDVAYKVGFKEKDDDGNIVAKNMWQNYTLAFMMQYPDKGMQEEMYKSMVVAKSIGLLDEEMESRWDEPLSKEEAIELIINTQLAKNHAYGYLSEVEYGKINADKFKIQKDTQDAIGVDEETGLEYGEGWTEVPAKGDPAKMLSSGMTLSEAKSLIEVEIEVSKISGLNEEETKKALEDLAKQLGTTMAEVNSISVSGVIKPVQEQPSYTEDIPSDVEAGLGIERPSNNGGGNSNTNSNTGSGSTETPSGNSGGNVQQPSSGGDGTGGDGSFDGHIHTGTGTSEEDPDFQLEMP